MGAHASRPQAAQEQSQPTVPPIEQPVPDLRETETTKTTEVMAPTQVTNLPETEPAEPTEVMVPTASWNLDGSDDSEMTLQSAGFGAHMIASPINFTVVPSVVHALHNSGKRLLVSYVLCLPTKEATTGTSDRNFTRTDQPMHFVQCEFYTRNRDDDANDPYGDVWDFARRVHMTDSDRLMKAGGKNLFLCFDAAGALVQTLFVKGHNCEVLAGGLLENFPPTPTEVDDNVGFPLRPPLQTLPVTPGSDIPYVKAVMSAMYFAYLNNGTLWEQTMEQYGRRIADATESSPLEIRSTGLKIFNPIEVLDTKLPPKACFALATGDTYYVFASKYHYMFEGNTFFFTFLYDCKTTGSYCVPLSYINDEKRSIKFKVDCSFRYNKLYGGGGGSAPASLAPHRLLPALLLAAAALASTVAM